ncbi:SH2 domain-containing protein 5, partial [Nipponia nippon]
QYVGSFAVEDLDLQQQAGRLEEQLRALKGCWDPVAHPPTLSPQTLLMAHALRRILYSTWRHADRAFAVGAPNPAS